MIFCTTTSEHDFVVQPFFWGGKGCFFFFLTDDFLNMCFCFAKDISYQVLEDEKHLSIEQ